MLSLTGINRQVALDGTMAQRRTCRRVGPRSVMKRAGRRVFAVEAAYAPVDEQEGFFVNAR